MNNRRCSNCANWEEDELFDDSRGKFGGYCKLVTKVTKLTWEDMTCPKHRFKRGQKN